MSVFNAIGNGLYTAFGISGTGPVYGFLSGFGGSNFPIVITGLLLLRHQNCHTKGCWRLGHHIETGDVVCHRHHPGGARAGRNVPWHEIKARYDAHHAARATIPLTQSDSGGST